jgi:hypothetical protein
MKLPYSQHTNPFFQMLQKPNDYQIIKGKQSSPQVFQWETHIWIQACLFFDTQIQAQK